MFFRFGCAACAATITCVMAFSPMTAKADTQTSPSSPSLTRVSDAGALRVASTGLNLLNQPKARASSAGRKRVAVGNGSYVCSPAGFGQRSRCYSK